MWYASSKSERQFGIENMECGNTLFSPRALSSFSTLALRLSSFTLCLFV